MAFTAKWFLLLLSVASASLRPESSLETDCYGFPGTSFSASNSVKETYGSSPHIPIGVGDSAYEMTLPDVDETLVKFSEVLAKRDLTVVMWGMYTCPALQGLGSEDPFDQCSYEDEYRLVDAYEDRVSFVHLVGPEPHPLPPDVNFDSGRQSANYWSTISQPRTWSEKLHLARTRIATLMHPSTTLLVDPLIDGPTARNQPAWCSIGQGARTALLIDKSGTVRFTQDWFRRTNMANAIEEALRQQRRDVAARSSNNNDADVDG